MDKEKAEQYSPKRSLLINTSLEDEDERTPLLKDTN
jgi:hypothetical protein